MFEGHIPLSEPLGTGYLDVETTINVTLLCPKYHTEGAEVVGRKSGHRHDQMFQVRSEAVRPRHPAGRWKPAQGDGKKEDQRNAEHEVRHRDTDDVESRDSRYEHTPPRGHAVEHDGERTCDKDGPECQLECDRHGRADR